MADLHQTFEEKLPAFLHNELESPLDHDLVQDFLNRSPQGRESLEELQRLEPQLGQMFESIAQAPAAPASAQALSNPVSNSAQSPATRAWGFLKKDANTNGQATPAPAAPAPAANPWGRLRSQVPQAPIQSPPPPPKPEQQGTMVLPQDHILPLPATPAPAPVAPATPVNTLASADSVYDVEEVGLRTPRSKTDNRAKKASARLRRPSSDLENSSFETVPASQTIKNLHSLIGEDLAGYRIEEPIAKGGMGMVFRGTQLSMDRPVAIKVLAPRLQQDEVFVRRFAREARAAAKLDHPNLVRIYDVGQDRGCSFYSMELVEGEDLKDILKRDGPMDIERAARLAVQACMALELAKTHGIVHRDVKPANMLIVGKNDQLKLADLGLAKEESPTTDGQITLEKQVMGSPNYMPPEQAEDIRKTDHQSDVYAVGATLYHMVTGLEPYGKGKPVEILARMLTTELEWPAQPQVDGALKGIILKAMAKSRADRFESAKDMREELQQYLAGNLQPRARSLNSSGDLRLSGTRRAAKRAPRRSEAVAASPSMMALLLSFTCGFIVMAMVGIMMPKGESEPSGTPVTDNSPQPETKQQPSAPKTMSSRQEREEARIRELETLRKEFSKLKETLHKDRSKYADRLAMVEHLGSRVQDANLTSDIQSLLRLEQSLSKELDDLLAAKLDAGLPVDTRPRIKALDEASRRFAYHPKSETIPALIQSVKDQEEGWFKTQLVSIDGKRRAGDLKGALAAAEDLDKQLKGWQVHDDYKARITPVIDGLKLEWQNQLEKQKRNQLLTQLAVHYDKSYVELRDKGPTEFKKRSELLRRFVTSPEGKLVAKEINAHIEDIDIVAAAYTASLEALMNSSRDRKWYDLRVRGSRKYLRVGKGTKDNVQDNMITLKVSGAGFQSFKIQNIESTDLLKIAGLLDNQHSERAVFYALRGEFKYVLPRINAARKVNPKALPGFEERLKVYRNAEARALYQDLAMTLKEHPERLSRSSERNRLKTLLTEFGDTETVKANKQQLSSWQEASLASADTGTEDGDGAVTPGGKANAKLSDLFHVPVTGKPEKATIAFNFKEKKEKEDWYMSDRIVSGPRTEEFLRTSVKSEEKPKEFKDIKDWKLQNESLWLRGWNSVFTFAKFAPGPLRIEVEAKCYNGRNLCILINDERPLNISPGIAIPKVLDSVYKQYPQVKFFYDQWNQMTELKARVFRFIPIGDRKSWRGRRWAVLADRQKGVVANSEVQKIIVELVPSEWLRKKGKLKDGFKAPFALTMKSGKVRLGPVPIDLFPEGPIGLNAWGGHVEIKSLKVTGRLDPEWIKKKSKEKD